MFKIASINSRGLASSKIKVIFNLCKSYDVFLIQESLSNNPSFYQDLSRQWTGGFYYCPAVGRQGGVITLISKDFCGSVLSWRRDANGRVISLLISYGDVRINVVNIYAPTNLAERKIFFENLHAFFFCC